MIPFLELIIVIFGGVLGGIALVIFGYICINVFLPMLVWAMERKEKRITRAPWDYDFTGAWKREWEAEQEADKRRV